MRNAGKITATDSAHLLGVSARLCSIKFLKACQAVDKYVIRGLALI